MSINESTIRSLSFFADKIINNVVQVSNDPVILNAVVHTPGQKYFCQGAQPTA